VKFVFFNVVGKKNSFRIFRVFRCFRDQESAPRSWGLFVLFVLFDVVGKNELFGYFRDPAPAGLSTIC